MFTKDLVDASQHTGNVLVNVDDADVVGLVGSQAAEVDLGHVDGTDGGALVDVLGQGLGDFDTDGALGFLGTATDVGGEDQVLERAEVLGPGVELLVEVFAVAGGLVGVDVNGGTGNLSTSHGLDEGGDVNNGTS